MFESKLPNLGTSIFRHNDRLPSKVSTKRLIYLRVFPEFDAPELLKKQLNHYVLEGVKSICAFKRGHKATTATSGFDC